MKTQPFIVVGCAYSGTSMTMKILEKLGVNVGSQDKYISPARKEMAGFVLSGGRGWNTREIPVVRYIAYERGLSKARKLSLIDEFFGDSEKWGFKFLLPFEILREILSLYPNAKLVHIHRNSQSRNWPNEDWAKQQREYEWKLVEVLKDFSGVTKITLEYDAITENPAGEINLLAKFVGTTFTKELETWTNGFVKKGGAPYG